MKCEIMTTRWANETRCGESEIIYKGAVAAPHELWFEKWVKEHLRQQGEKYTWDNDRSFSLFSQRENKEPYWVTSLWASEVQQDD